MREASVLRSGLLFQLSSPVIRRFFRATSEKRVRNDMVIITTTRAPHARRGTSHVNFSLVPVRSDLFLFSTCTAHAAFRAAGPAPRRERMPGPHVGILSTLFADSAIGVVSRASRARCRPSGTPPSRSWPIAARRAARAKKRDAPRTPSLPFPPTLTPSDPILATRHGISRHQPS